MNGTHVSYLAIILFTRLGSAQETASPLDAATPPVSAAPTIAPVPATAPTTAAAPTPPATPAPPPARTHTVLSPGEAIVHVAVDYGDAWLETRSYVDGGPFHRTCRAPCDLRLQVQGMEARVVAPGMTTSNNFGFDPGTGTAGVRVEGGSASARRWGIVTLATGIPFALAGMALFALGRVKDNSGLQIGGIAGLAVGGVSVGVSLPLLFKGTTHVKDAKGALIALSVPSPAIF